MPRIAQDGRQPLHPDLFSNNRFDGFGPSRFHLPGELPGGDVVAGRSSVRLRHGMREKAPQRPGVYGMLDSRGWLIYVGKAKNLRARLLSYFRNKSRDPKAARIIRHTRWLAWEYAENEFAALIRELELIQRFRPRFNVIGQPGRSRYFYISLGRSPAPYAYLTRDPSKNDMGVYGPFVGRRRAEQAIRRLNDVFLLRDCPSSQPIAFSDQPKLFPLPTGAGCLRHEIGTCLGPCAALCTRRSYGNAARSMLGFLDGRDRSVLARIKQEMMEASTQQAYERAMAIRDKLLDMEWIDQRLSLLRKAREQNSFVYIHPGNDGRNLWYILDRGQVWSVIREPTDEESRLAASKMLSEIRSGQVLLGTSSHQPVDSVLLVAAWFRKYEEERTRLIPLAAMLARLAGSE